MRPIDVLFLAPTYPPEMRQYVRALSELGVRVFGVGDTPKGSLPADAQRHLTAYLAVPRLLDEDDVLERTSAWLRGREVERVLCNWEPLIILAARMRERWGVPGKDVDTAHGFRDKELMKARVAAAGLRVPRSARARSVKQAWAAAESVGYPLIVKPIAGAGSADTHRVDDASELEAVLAQLRHIDEVSVEEFIEGEERTYDTICAGGQPLYENVAQYLPRPLDARTKEWVSPVIITVRDHAQPALEGGIELGRRVLGALGMDDGFTHMEWYRTKAGEVVFGEIGARPGGAHLVDQMNYTSDVDLFREWARAACFGAVGPIPPRQYNCAIIFKRAKGAGAIREIRGAETLRRALGPALVEERLLPVGAPRRNWRHTLVSDGFWLLRHPDWDEAKRLAGRVATELELIAG